MGVPPGAYERLGKFVRNVIMPATLEVNGPSDTGVRIDLVRKSPRAPVRAVAMCWWRKSPEEFEAAAKERNRSKAAGGHGCRRLLRPDRPVLYIHCTRPRPRP